MAGPKDEQEGLDQLLAQAWARLGGAVFDAASDVAAQGSFRAPLDLGPLRASIYADANLSINEVKKTVTAFVVARRTYAWVQHEREDFNHPKGGEAKYLAKPLRERMPQYRESFRQALREALQTVSGGA
jgi:hypothetical protein